MATEPDAPEDILGELPPLPPFDPRTYMFTTRTIAGARTFADHLPSPGEVWELEGKYYPVKRNSEEAAWLRDHGASLVPPEDDALHQEFDPFLVGLQRADKDRDDL
ncbi:MAG TPA: hypothetical protein VF746_03215 [Longimicrobium sp.]|jgi:hypothetical protein